MTSESCQKEFDHDIQLQAYDNFGLAINGTQFWITLKIVKDGKRITIQLPTINFQISPAFNPDGETPGGTIRTIDGFLPEDLRPSDPVYRSYLVASNNGMSLPFSFVTPPTELPVPPVGYILSVTLFGAIIIQGVGTFNNLIPPGPQILMPTDVSYSVKPSHGLCQNFKISPGVANITQFPPSIIALGGYRDSHVNDAFDGVFAWTWVDNSNVPDKTNGTMNAWVAVGKLKKGKLKMRKPVQLSNLAPGIFSWSTAVAINRTDKNNIVVSYSILNFPTASYRAVSFDGGKTWPAEFNGPTNIQPINGAGDNRGVAADKYGNIWYGTTNIDLSSPQQPEYPTFWISTDGGVTFSVAYTVSPIVYSPNDEGWDYPQFCFGGDGQGNYGLWFSADYYAIDYITGEGVSIIPSSGFLPITGKGTYGTGNSILLNSLANTQAYPVLAASEDGRVWSNFNTDESVIFTPWVVRFKSPGPLDVNYAGPWNLTMTNVSPAYGFGNAISYPGDGYLAGGVQDIIYDEKRKALYLVLALQVPESSQDLSIFLIISRNNGQSWSDPFYISTTNFANRGFQSMALDIVTGDLVFGWLRWKKRSNVSEYGIFWSRAQS